MRGLWDVVLCSIIEVDLLLRPHSAISHTAVILIVESSVDNLFINLSSFSLVLCVI